jgi:hypothetical protein
MDLDRLRLVADRARARSRLAVSDVSFVRRVAPRQLDSFPRFDAGAIRYFDCRELSRSVKRIVRQRQWRFATPCDPRMVRWALGDKPANESE